MVRATVLAVVLAVTASCGGGSSAPATAAMVAQAGDVREVSGTVTARAGSAAPRPLAVGDVVSSDDVIETGTDGSVVIELRHNGVRWSLGPAQSKQVSQSVAWQAPRAPAATPEAHDRETAAGRHAERSAAETAETAVVEPTTEPGAEERRHAPPKHPDGKGEPDLLDEPESGGDLEANLGERRQGTGITGGGAVTAPCDSPPCRSAESVHAEVSIGASDNEVRARLQSVYVAAMKRCYQDLLKRDPTATGDVRVTFTTNASGRVTHVDVDTPGSIAPTHDCLVRVMKSTTWPEGDDETDYTFTLSFGSK